MTDVSKPARKKKVFKKSPKQYQSGDGFSRSPEVERGINEAFALTFHESAASAKVLNYIKNITVNRVLPPETPAETVKYHEGARWLAAIILKRIADGEEKKP